MGTKTVSWCDRCGEETEGIRGVKLSGSSGIPAIIDTYDLCDDCLTILLETFDEFAKYKNTLGR